MRRAEISFESEPFQFAAARQVSKSQAGRKTSLGAFSFVCDHVTALCENAKSYKAVFSFHLYIYLLITPSLLLFFFFAFCLNVEKQ